ncbi:MAG: YeeE/YedE thiosulfate transporter family protein [Sporomusaceae bacterium]|nr:YeeE/YedE thiosulfate transporter family protein [Sporomusaceae bacterium]
MTELLYGFVTGVLFGFFLQKGRVLRYDKQLGALRLVDFTIVKFMLSHVVVAMVGVYLLYDLGLVKLAVKPTILGGVVIGGLIFGLGWGLVGYCPGTAVAALGEGRLDAAWAILGMLVGAGLYAEAFPWLKTTVLTWGNYGKITLPQALGVNHWVVIAAVVALTLLLFWQLERYEAAKPALKLQKRPGQGLR